jgi:hypothetical protein
MASSASKHGFFLDLNSLAILGILIAAVTFLILLLFGASEMRKRWQQRRDLTYQKYSLNRISIMDRSLVDDEWGVY